MTGRRRLAYALFAGTIVFGGCSSRKINPNLLTTEKYNKIRYVSSAPQGVPELGRVEVSRRAGEAGIRSTLPALYEKGIERGGRFISDIAVKTTAKKELFDVPYQKCERVMENVSKRECKTATDYRYTCEYVGGKQQCGSKPVSVQKCDNVSKTEWRDKCTTTYQKELRWVLYQTAGGIVYGNP